MDALDDLDEGGSKGFRSLTAGQGPEADAVKEDDDVEGGDDEVEDDDVADDEGEGADDEEQNYPEDDTEADEKCDEEDCKEEQQTEVDEEVDAPESDAVKQEEPSQDKPEAESVMDGQGKGMTLENMMAKLDAMDNSALGTKSKSQADANGEVDEKQKELDKVFGGGGDGGDKDEDLFGIKNAKQEPELDLMADDEKEDEMVVTKMKTYSALRTPNKSPSLISWLKTRKRTRWHKTLKIWMAKMRGTQSSPMMDQLELVEIQTKFWVQRTVCRRR